MCQNPSVAKYRMTKPKKAKPTTPAEAIKVLPSGLWDGGEGVDISVLGHNADAIDGVDRSAAASLKRETN
jgi:hypothetical protein